MTSKILQNPRNKSLYDLTASLGHASLEIQPMWQEDFKMATRLL